MTNRLRFKRMNYIGSLIPLMKIITIAFILLSSFHITAQHLVSAKLIDAKSEEPIPYANIGIIENNLGTVSNDRGIFEMDVEVISAQLTISSIGYETKKINASDIKLENIIKLNPTDYKIEIVEIQASRFNSKDVILGAKNKKRGQSIGFGGPQLGSEIAAAIRIDKPTYIKTANFVLNHAKGDSLFLRVNIYDFSEGQCGKKLLNENVFIKEKQRKGVYTVDLSPYNLVLESDVLLSLEWLRNFDAKGNKDITFDTKKMKKLKGVYVRYSSNGTMNKVSHMTNRKPCFYFEAKQNN